MSHDVKRYYILKDQSIIGIACTHEEAVEAIRRYQSRETHYLLRSEYSILPGDQQEFIRYERSKP